MHHHGTFGAEILQHLGKWLDPLFREYTHHLTLDVGWIGKRTEQIEDRTRTKLDARRTDMLHGRMVRGCEHEADASLVNAVSDLFRREIDLHSERAEHVGRPRARRKSAIAMLGNRHARARDDKGGTGRDVVGT